MNRLTKVFVGLAIAGVLTIAAVGVAAAQSTNDCQPTTWPGGHRGWGMWECGHWTAFDAAAEVLGLTPQQLFTELHGGKTLQEVAEANGVELATVQQALTEVRQQERSAAIQQAVEEGTLTQAQADWMLEGLKLGMGPFAGGPHGLRGQQGGQR